MKLTHVFYRAFFFLCLAIFPPVQAAAVHVAVAGNFAATHKDLAEIFSERTGFEVITSTASSGALFAQIRNGAPFDVFLSADERLPHRLEVMGLAVEGSRFTYAFGRLVLFGRDAKVISDGEKSLADASFSHLAIANPEVAPYGMAARQTLEFLGLWKSLQPRIVRGTSVLQTYQFIATGNAELGFVALSQVLAREDASSRGYWEVPREYHQPLRQDAVLLQGAVGNEAARAYHSFLKRQTARRLIQASGYRVAER